jgi:4-amino-4-deoxy-L-arabinose transferase-like glycosyltransferase
MLKRVLSSPLFPRLLIAGFLLLMVCTIFIHAHDYGVSVDEPLQNSYGHYDLAWYLSLGKDQSFLHYRAKLYMPQHGPFFEGLVAIAQQLLGHELTTRAIVTGLAGVAGVVAAMLCGYVLGGEWLALVAGLFLWGYPRYFGSMWNNSKDIPLAAAMTMVLWAVLLLVTQWQSRRRLVRNSLLVGLLLGIAISIRVTGLVWCIILVVLALGWWLIHLNQEYLRTRAGMVLKKQALSALLIGGICFVTMLALWPYFFLNPLGHLLESVELMQHYPWALPVTFQGGVYSSLQLPWDYVPVWLGIGSPLIIDLFALTGLVLWLGLTIHTRKIDAPITVIALALPITIGVMIISRPTLYDGPRHFFFLVPIMILLAAWGFFTLCRLLWQRPQFVVRLLAVFVVIAAAIDYGLIFKTMNDLHPYEYTYFNELVGGIEGAQGNYDIDYWRICTKPAAEWLSTHYQSLTHNPHPTVTSPFAFLALYSLPPVFSQNDTNPDFYIGSAHDHFDQLFPNYTIIHTERINGQVLACVVKMRPSSPPAINGDHALAPPTLTIRPVHAGNRLPRREMS